MSFWCLKFLPKTNENKSHSSKNEFVRSFFGRIQDTIICFRDYLTFNCMSIKIILDFHTFSDACCVKLCRMEIVVSCALRIIIFFLLSDALNFKCQDSLYKNDFNTFSSRFCQVTYFSMPTDVKFIYSEKATQFCEIFTLLLTGTT